MDIDNQIKVMQAYKAGKTIESTPNNNDYWAVNLDPKWNWVHIKYRVKEEPELVPFSYEDAELLIGKVLKHKHSADYVVVTRVSKPLVSLNGFNSYYEELLDDFTFLDGSPCGKFV